MKNMRRKERGKKQNRRISAAVSLCLILSLFLRPLTVYATAGEAPDITGDKNKNYSIRVMMVFDDKTVEGGSFEAYRVGEIVKLKAPLKATGESVETTDGDAYRFWPTESLVKAMGLEQDKIDEINNINKDDYDALSQLNAILSDKLGGSDLNGIETAAQKEKLAKALAAYVQSPTGQESEASKQNDAVGAAEGDDGDDGGVQEMPDVWGDDHATRENENGEVTFEDLRTGLYLFTQSTEQAAPGYYPVEPFLVSVPILAKEGYDYAVEAYPNDHEVKIYVKFRLMALDPDPPGPDPDPDPDPEPDPDPDPDPDPPGPEPDPDPDPGIETWVQEYLADPLSIGEPSVLPRLPQTGQMNWPVPVLAVFGSAMLLFGMALHLSRKIGKVCIGAGILIMMTGLFLFLSNQREAHAADDMAKTALTEVKEAIEKRPDTILNIVSEESDAAKEDAGYEYIGYISVPSLQLELPVMDEWDYARLKIAPCRYYGSDREDNMVIAAHNYAGHFGMLSKLEKGDEVFFTDMDGTEYRYEVDAVDILAPEAVEEMTASEYNLTLFTCTYGGANRVTVRCFRKI